MAASESNLLLFDLVTNRNNTGQGVDYASLPKKGAVHEELRPPQRGSSMTTAIQHAWENLSNTLRLYVESHMDFAALYKVDRPDAVTRQDRALEAKLEKFHTLYDVTKHVPGFDFFRHADTSLLIVMRNAIHHRDHPLFVSWEAFVLAQEAAEKLPSNSYLFASTTPEANRMMLRYYVPLDDFRERLTSPMVKNADALSLLWDQDLRFAQMRHVGSEKGFEAKSVYVDMMPAFISAMHRLRGWLSTMDFVPSGSDGRIYFESFGEVRPEPGLSFRER
ncbi:hypothetical protein [Janthinobacterium sp. MDB2-8]|uniref:hypothetical protein n=1 Tax=Janthinobacterium sp. MDB2-8 TaxID=1259338 RepID=UPI003F23D9E9